jgi:DNA polymerase-1
MFDALIFDGKALVCRQYYATQGEPEAPDLTDGLLRLMHRMSTDLGATLRCVAWESGPLLRRETFPDYKIHRKAHPDDLSAQLAVIPDRLAASGVHVLAVPLYEADDVMATAARALSLMGYNVGIVTRDKDLLWCVKEATNVSGPIYLVFPTSEGYKTTTPEDVRATWGVTPAQVPHVLALMGDSSDNVPGVRGIGQKGASELIARHGNLAAVLEVAAGPRPSTLSPAMTAKLRGGRDAALLSLELVKLHDTLPIALDLGAMGVPTEAHDEAVTP